MTSKTDIVQEKILDALIALKSQGLLSESEFSRIKSEVIASITYEVEDRKAKQSEIEWNLTKSFLYQ